MTDERAERKWKQLLASICLFLVACALPALMFLTRHYSDNTHWAWGGYRSVRGLDLLFQGIVFGWMRLNFAAFANFPLWLSWIFFRGGNWAAARTSALVAMVMSLQTFQILLQPYYWDESGSARGYLAWPHVGYFCWVGSMLVIWASSAQRKF